MASRAARWITLSEEQLASELESFVAETNHSRSPVRIFWKLGPDYVFGGCNDAFGRDAGLPASQVIGINDFDRKLPWGRQAAKFRADDKKVVTAKKAELDILERQDSSSGVVYVLVGKAPVLLPNGEAVGIVGMYELIDETRAAEIFARQAARPS